MAQCQSYVFFPDDPTQPPQFSDCPRMAETTRRTFRMGITNGRPVVNLVVKNCVGHAQKNGMRQRKELSGK